MKIPLVKVGNSRGIRIPKAIIDQCNLAEEVNLEVRDDAIVISRASVRSGWAQAFDQMRRNEDDILLDAPIENDWDEKGWEWK